MDAPTKILPFTWEARLRCIPDVVGWQSSRRCELDTCGEATAEDHAKGMPEPESMVGWFRNSAFSSFSTFFDELGGLRQHGAGCESKRF